MTPEIAQLYGNKVRIRVCGLCWEEDRLLLVKHNMGDHVFWSPPGGGLEFGETVEQTLTREVLEETGLVIEPGRFLFGCEFVQQPLHAIELFFEIKSRSGVLISGKDPEVQIIELVDFMSADDIAAIPRGMRHGIFNIVGDVKDLRKLTGFHRI
jgi:8-oxo-dGTP diphosphatase